MTATKSYKSILFMLIIGFILFSSYYVTPFILENSESLFRARKLQKWTDIALYILPLVFIKIIIDSYLYLTKYEFIMLTDNGIYIKKLLSKKTIPWKIIKMVSSKKSIVGDTLVIKILGYGLKADETIKVHELAINPDLVRYINNKIVI